MNTVTLQAFSAFDEGLKPPPLEINLDQNHINLDNNHIISMRNGLILSRYGDDIWDLSPYGATAAVLTFTSILSSTLKKEAKRMSYILMTHTTGKNKSILSGQTMSIKFNQFIRPVAEYIQHLQINKEEKSFNYLLAHPKRFRRHIITFVKKNNYAAKSIYSILTLLKANSESRTGFKYIPNKLTENAISIIQRRYENSYSQTILIPVDIYTAAAKMRLEHIDTIKPYIKKLAGFIKDYSVCKGFGSKNNEYLNIEDRKGFVEWSNAINKHKLLPLFKQYDVTCLRDFFGFIHMLQGTCRHLIHQYTGMRNNECCSLNRECWQEKNENMPSRIHGIEQKISGQPTRQTWITHDVLKPVIELLLVIGKPMAYRASPTLGNPPLMIKISKLTLRKIGDNHYEALQPIKTIRELPFSNLESITLTKKHIEEMSLVDDRDWNEHKWVKEGAVWQFKTHQYRRALAVYALGSDLLSLFAIKEQFGHLLSNMTAYYANGHKSARKLDGNIDDKDHIATYMRKISNEMMFFSFRKNVMLSNVPLYGANGMFLEKHLVAKTPEEREIVMKNSEKYKKEFKRNGRFYTETAMGGCTNAYCEKRLLPDFLLSIICFGCDDSILKLNKAERLTEKLRLATMKYAEIQPNGIDHRTMVKIYDEMSHFTDILKRKEQREHT